MENEYLYDTYAKLGNSNYLYLTDVATNENVVIDCIDKKDIDRDCFYCLYNGKLKATEVLDGYLMAVENVKNVGDYIVRKTTYIEGDNYNKKGEVVYVASRGKYNAHGKTIKQAITDVEFKYLQSQELKDHILRIKNQGYITANDYRLLTGACWFGTNRWLEQNGFTWEDNKPIQEVVELTKGEYGHNKLLEIYRQYFL